MKIFNKTITIEVEVDQIAKMLLDTMKEEFAHRETLTETIIGIALNHGTIGNIYSNLNGHVTDLDFNIGQIVKVVGLTYYDGGTRSPVEEAQISDIDVNKPSGKVQVSFYKGSATTLSYEWVDHNKLTVVKDPTQWAAAEKTTKFNLGE